MNSNKKIMGKSTVWVRILSEPTIFSHRLICGESVGDPSPPWGFALFFLIAPSKHRLVEVIWLQVPDERRQSIF